MKSTLAETVAQIPAKRWFAIRRALDMPVEEITEDPIALLVVACNEVNRAVTGKDDWARFLDATLGELTSMLEAEDADSKSEDASA